MGPLEDDERDGLALEDDERDRELAGRRSSLTLQYKNGKSAASQTIAIPSDIPWSPSSRGSWPISRSVRTSSSSSRATPGER